MCCIHVCTHSLVASTITITSNLQPIHSYCMFTLQNPKDTSYVFSGYAPLSIRLIEMLEKPNGFAKMEEVRMTPLLSLSLSLSLLHTYTVHVCVHVHMYIYMCTHIHTVYMSYTCT